MKTLVIGSTGFIGSALVPFLRAHGHVVTRVTRSPSPLSEDSIFWNPLQAQKNPSVLEGYELIINLAGENISGIPWTVAKKKRVWDSRILFTQALTECLATLKYPPKMLINASAMGYYGNRGDELLTEHDPHGKGFLSDLCVAWETAAKSIENENTSVACLRFGVILSPKGGAFAKMLFPFKWGLGGKMGSGKQYMSWIVLEDVLQIILHVLNKSMRGSINVGTPHPVTNEEFTKTLGELLHRPTFLTMPSSILRLFLGDFADEALLSSTRMIPQRLINNGYLFSYPELKEALVYLLAGGKN